jgi:hypothetical protein
VARSGLRNGELEFCQSTRVELKAQREEEGQDELNKCFGVVEELEGGGIIVEVDGNRSVLSSRFVGPDHVSSPCGWQLVLMRYREDNVLKDQAYSERIGASPLNPMECGWDG